MLTNKFRSFDIESRVSSHGSNNLEIKLEYNLEELVKANNYKIETYFFIPSSLRISESNYTKEDFYSSTKNYIRFMNPRYTLAQILNVRFKSSPLYRLRKIIEIAHIEKNNLRKEAQIEKSIKELKLLGTMVRARLRDWRISMKQELESSQINNQEILNDFEGRMLNCIRILLEFRKIKKKYYNYNFDKAQVNRYFRIVEEFISYLIEERLVDVLRLIEKSVGKAPTQNKKFKELKNQFQEFISKEHKLRKKEKFKLAFENTERGKEKYLYYFHQYRKTISSVLYLDVARKKKSTTRHIIAAWAAFLAASINSYIAIHISRTFAADTMFFVILMASLYVFKDRIKNIAKLIGDPKVLSRFPDHQTVVKALARGKQIKLGLVREKFFFSTRNRIDPLVLRLRDRTSYFAQLPQRLLEKIMVYQQEININTRVIKKHHTRTINLADITRFNIGRFLENMEGPESSIHYWDKSSKAASAKGSRVYHIALVLKHTKLAKNKKSLHYERYRITCTRLGIKRIEAVSEV